MIEINLLPKPKKPDKDLQRILNPLITYLIETSHEHAKLAKNEEDLLLWGKTWAGLLCLRQELIPLGFGQTGTSKKLVVEGSIEDVEDAIFG
jgi:hypothetical protein